MVINTPNHIDCEVLLPGNSSINLSPKQVMIYFSLIWSLPLEGKEKKSTDCHDLVLSFIPQAFYRNEENCTAGPERSHSFYLSYPPWFLGNLIKSVGSNCIMAPTFGSPATIASANSTHATVNLTFAPSCK
jgi:hypothetical protein